MINLIMESFTENFAENPVAVICGILALLVLIFGILYINFSKGSKQDDLYDIHRFISKVKLWAMIVLILCLVTALSLVF